MGVGVSSWQLARSVAEQGQLGVLSGTALAVTVARRLAIGDPDGDVQRALARFPVSAVAERILERYLDTERPANGPRFRAVARPNLDPDATQVELTVAANFVEVSLAKEGHDGLVGINYLEKIQLPTLPSIYGAMLAGVDHVLVGAGVPVRFPAILDALAEHDPVTLPIEVIGATGDDRRASSFDPRSILGDARRESLSRPEFLAIVSSATLATYLARSATGRPDGFVVEGHDAGGHNAPPRGKLRLDDAGEPIYGPRDAIDLEAIAAIGLPFWLAGGYAAPERLQAARAAGACGVQVGTAFAFCDESGLDQDLRRRTLEAVRAGTATVRTDALASPTGFPFKVLELPGTLSEPEVAEERPRLCDLGYLREVVGTDDGGVDYRCAAEPVADYVAKGGDEADTVGRRCLCNALVANIGLGQRRPGGYHEAPLLTSGDGVDDLGRFLSPGASGYSARDVIDHLLVEDGDRSHDGSDHEPSTPEGDPDDGPHDVVAEVSRMGLT